MRYADEGVPLVVLAGKEYGSGSSRDWAAKGTALLGVRAVIAESYERIHRSNLIGMGVVPLQFPDGEGVDSLGLTGEEMIDVEGLDEALAARSAEARKVRVTADARRRRPSRVRRPCAARHAQRGRVTTATAAFCNASCATFADLNDEYPNRGCPAPASAFY